jgi:hypothetical protein
MWDRRIVRSYDPDPDFNNLAYRHPFCIKCKWRSP